MSRLRATRAIAVTTGNKAPSRGQRSSSARHRSHVCQVPRAWHAPRVLALLAFLAACGIGAGCTNHGRRAPAALAPERDAGTSDRAVVTAPEAALARPPLAAAPAPALALVPRPRHAVACSGSFSVGDVNGIVIDDDPALRAIALRLAGWLGIGPSLVRAIAAGAPGPSHPIVLRLDRAAPATPRVVPPRDRDPSVEPPRDLDDEAYGLDISPDRVVLRAHHPAGLFYAAQTLAQLAGTRPLSRPPGAAPAPARARELPCLHIDDAPAQRVRAMHLDVARHFFSKELVERYIDLLAFYRFNVFHWHLTDDQGFRLAIRSHPELTQIGARRIEDGHEVAGSYTQDDAREIVARAKDSFVTVVPEIEMPGHARAILASHPELSCTGKKQEVPATWGIFDDVLCAGNDATYRLLDDVLRETAEVFPSRLVHVGGDEVPKTRWNACPKCRARMAKEGLDAEQLHGAFLKRVGAMLSARGRRMVAWDDALESGLPQDAVVVAWQSTERGRVAAAAGHDVVMAPSDTTYFNFWQTRAVHQPGHEGDLPWTKVLAFDPRPSSLGLGDAASALGARVLGGEGALWTEYVRSSDELDTLLLPRLAALSEALWSEHGSPAASSAGAASFPARFTAQRPMLDAANVRYFVEPPVGLRAKKVFVETATLELARPAIHPDGVVRFTLDGSDPTGSSPVYEAPIVLRATTSAAARLFLPGGRTSDVVRGTFEHSALHPPIQPSMSPAMLHEGVLYKYFEGDFHALPAATNLTPVRSGRLSSLSLEPSFRAERFAVVYDAWLMAPADGVYRFVARADDGVALEVDGVRVLVDDGEHPARESDGEIALARGPHTVRLLYFQGAGGKELLLRCDGPGLPAGRCALVSP